MLRIQHLSTNVKVEVRVMGRRFVVMPSTGHPTRYTPRSVGREIRGTITLEGEVLESGEQHDPRARTLGSYKAEFWDPVTSSLRLRIGGNVFTVGNDVINGVSDDAIVVFRMKLQPEV
jgi:hypothetical protein